MRTRQLVLEPDVVLAQHPAGDEQLGLYALQRPQRARQRLQARRQRVLPPVEGFAAQQQPLRRRRLHALCLLPVGGKGLLTQHVLPRV